MRSDSLAAHGVGGLLTTYAAILHALNRHGVVRSYNTPVADITEWLVSEHLGLALLPKSNKSVDAVDDCQLRYQIKGRWIAGRNKSKQLGAIRDLNSNPFDFLVAVVFDSDFVVDYAAIIPLQVVQRRCTPVSRTNSHRFSFTRSVLSEPGVIDITEKLQEFPPTEAEKKFIQAAKNVRVAVPETR
jgi:hypothetical protein